MGTVLRAFFLCFMWAGIMTMQINFESDASSTRKMKNALELAVHDAALAIDTNRLAQGEFVYDRTQAEANLKKSLQDNLALDSTLAPLSDSFLQSPVQIKLLEYYDDASGALFPFNYNNPTYEILDTIDGPAIVVVLETTGPRHFTGAPMTIRQSVVYEYNGLP